MIRLAGPADAHPNVIARLQIQFECVVADIEFAIDRRSGPVDFDMHGARGADSGDIDRRVAGERTGDPGVAEHQCARGVADYEEIGGPAAQCEVDVADRHADDNLSSSRVGGPLDGEAAFERLTGDSEFDVVAAESGTVGPNVKNLRHVTDYDLADHVFAKRVDLYAKVAAERQTGNAHHLGRTACVEGETAARDQRDQLGAFHAKADIVASARI